MRAILQRRNGTAHRHLARIAIATATLLLFLCGSAAADCTCRAKGRDYQHGERICLTGPTGPRLAVCGMEQNVASWIVTADSCAVSAITGRAHLAAAAFSTPPR